MEYEVVERSGGHEWVKKDTGSWTGIFCRVCGYVKKRDGSNTPCRGPAKVKLR